MSRFNPQVTYYRKERVAEVFFSALIAALFFPRRLFAEMPEAENLRNSAHLLALYMAVPTLMMTMTAGTGIPLIAPGFLSGLIAILLIFPVSLTIGITTSLLWSKYIAWATRRFTDSPLSDETVFQICAYSGAPFAIAWGPYLGPVMALWNSLLNWKGLVHHGGVKRLPAFLILTIGLLLAAAFVLVLAAVMMLLMPENTKMLMDTVLAYLASREF